VLTQHFVPPALLLMLLWKLLTGIKVIIAITEGIPVADMIQMLT
jgi:succinyl-CoA synthetase alpha subunit